MTRAARWMTFAMWLAAVVFAQAQSPTAALSGVVVSSTDATQPLRRAIVTLTGSELPTNISAITDDQGRFAFANLAPGRYTVTASKPAYLTSTYGATRPGRPGTPLALAAGQRVDNLHVALPRGAVITGAVRDMNGQPAPGIQVVVSDGRTQLGPGVFGASPRPDALVTDDRGIYRAYGLAPGDYVVAAIPRVSILTNIAIATDLDALFRTLPVPPATGATPMAPALQPAEPTYGYAPIFYPETSVAADAAKISVGIGEERGGIDIALNLVRSARVEGVLATADGQPLGAVRATMLMSGPPLPISPMPLVATLGVGGKFAFNNVVPGRYLLFAHADAGAGGSPAAASAYQEIAVNGTDIGGLEVTMRPPLSVSGRFAFDQTTITLPPNFAALHIGLTPSDGGGAMVDLTPSGMSPITNSAVRADGTFAISDVPPGRYLISSSVVSGPSATGWWLRSAMLGGRDLLDFPLEVAATSTDVSGIVLTLSDRHSELSGTLQTASGQPGSEYTVIVYPADRALWQPDARRIKSTRPADDGRFVVSDLPAGDYLIAALTDVAPDEWRDPAFLATLSSASVRVTIADGAKVSQALRVTR